MRGLHGCPWGRTQVCWVGKDRKGLAARGNSRCRGKEGKVRGVGAHRGKGEKERKEQAVELVRGRSRQASPARLFAVGRRLTRCE